MEPPWSAAFEDDPNGRAAEEWSGAKGTSSHGSGDRSDPFAKVLTRDEAKQLIFNGIQADADQYLFVLDDKLEASLGEMEYRIVSGDFT